MASRYDELISAIEETGVSRNEASHAVTKCVFAMAKQGVVGYGSGALLAFFLNPPAAMGLATIGLAVGAGRALTTSPQCSDVRQAIMAWDRAPI